MARAKKRSGRTGKRAGAARPKRAEKRTAKGGRVVARRPTRRPSRRPAKPGPRAKLALAPVATVSGEGGPLLLCDIRDFLRWRGEREDVEARIVKFYGTLVERLPPWLTPRGPRSWHQSIEVPTAADAQRFLEKLRTAVAALEPNVVEQVRRALSESEILAKANEALERSGLGMKAWLAAWRQSVEHGVDFLVGAERVLHFHVDAATDYDRASEPLADPASGGACMAAWTGGSRGVLWDLESEGSAEVFLDRARREVLVLRTWAEDPDDRAALRAEAIRGAEDTAIGELVLRNGLLVISWAPLDVGAFVGMKGDPGTWLREQAARKTPPRLSSADTEGAATLLHVTPGRWTVTRGARDHGERRNGRWCRLVYTD